MKNLEEQLLKEIQQGPAEILQNPSSVTLITRLLSLYTAPTATINPTEREKK